MFQIYRSILQENKINFLIFPNIWLFLPFLILMLYIPQSVYGIIVFNDIASVLLLKIFIVGLINYIATVLLLNKLLNNRIFIGNIKIKKITSKYKFSIYIYFIYFLLIIYACATVEKIGLIESLKGASTEDLSLARESFFKLREGIDRYLIYLFAILSTSLVPFFICLDYIKNSKYKHVFLALFCFSLLLTMEKAMILKALLPLCLLSFNGYIDKRYFKLVAFLGMLIIISSFMLSKFGTVDIKAEIKAPILNLKNQQETFNRSINENEKNRFEAKEIIEKLSKQINELRKLQDGDSKKQIIFYTDQKNYYARQLDFLENGQLNQLNEMIDNVNKQLNHYASAEKYLDKYFIFGSGRVAYLLNRIFWIPYVTSYDWVLFFETHLNAEHIYGRSSLLLSKITGQSVIKIEEEVFKFQFGNSAASTAAANTNFWVDGYVNFGWFGVIGYSLLIAFITMYVIWLANPALSACFYYLIFQLSMGGLTGVLFSNGLILLLVLAYFFPMRAKQ